MSVLYLSSLDSVLFSPVRTCTVLRSLTVGRSTPGVSVRLSPGVNGQEFGELGMADVFVLIARFEGDDVTRMLTFPFFVQIARRRGEDRETPAPHVPVEDLNLLAWGEVYETEEDARHQRFD